MTLRAVFRLQMCPRARLLLTPATNRSYDSGKELNPICTPINFCSRTDRKYGTGWHTSWNSLFRNFDRILSPYSRGHVRWWCSETPVSLPWSEILPFRSVRVNLTEAVHREGWALKRMEDFPPLLQSHISHWKAEGRTAIWLHIPLPLSALIPLAADLGFTLHHARGEEVVMNRWLREDKHNKLPHYASHQVGACGVVYREDTDEVLVAQDKFKRPLWKFPGGISEFAEDIADTAVREVKEETGVDAEFCSILAFIQHHHLPTSFDCSDLYFICRLTPLNFDLQPCPDEVLKCQWMSLDELAVSKEATPLSNRIAKLILEGKEKGFDGIDITMEECPSILPNMTYKLFVRSRKISLESHM